MIIPALFFVVENVYLRLIDMCIMTVYLNQEQRKQHKAQKRRC